MLRRGSHGGHTYYKYDNTDAGMETTKRGSENFISNTFSNDQNSKPLFVNCNNTKRSQQIIDIHRIDTCQ